MAGAMQLQGVGRAKTEPQTSAVREMNQLERNTEAFDSLSRKIYDLHDYVEGLKGTSVQDAPRPVIVDSACFDTLWHSVPGGCERLEGMVEGCIISLRGLIEG